MKGRFTRQIITTLRDNDIDKREQLVNDSIAELQQKGAKVIALQTKEYSVAGSVPQYLMTDIIYEEDDELTETRSMDKARFIKQILTRLSENDMLKREEQVNEECRKLAKAGAKILHFNTSRFGLTKLVTPMWMVTDILYEAENVVQNSSETEENQDAEADVKGNS